MNRLCFAVLVAVLLNLGTVPAHAYIGPGGGLSALGALLALIAAALLALLGFVWYPVKRLLRRRKKAQSTRSKGDRGQI